MKIMVRTISLILVILTVLSFVSCANRLEGKYKLEDDSVLNSNTLVGTFSAASEISSVTLAFSENGCTYNNQKQRHK